MSVQKILFIYLFVCLLLFIHLLVRKEVSTLKKSKFVPNKRPKTLKQVAWNYMLAYNKQGVQRGDVICYTEAVAQVMRDYKSGSLPKKYADIIDAEKFRKNTPKHEQLQFNF